ncbi:MAG: DUF2784 domain-containing protein [Deltaproteobacteria bacterium]|nr:DUF2784 domain-containing protein [Deltaproteobacteria bacterium]
MAYHLVADVVVGIHLLFVVFALLGALLLIRWPRIAWGHLPAVAWAAWIEFSGRICPLTPLENALRIRGGGSGYTADFVAHYMMGLLYPDALTRRIQIVLGAFVLVINVALYGFVFIWRKKKPPIE